MYEFDEMECNIKQINDFSFKSLLLIKTIEKSVRTRYVLDFNNGKILTTVNHRNHYRPSQFIQ